MGDELEHEKKLRVPVSHGFRLVFERVVKLRLGDRFEALVVGQLDAQDGVGQRAHQVPLQIARVGVLREGRQHCVSEQASALQRKLGEVGVGVNHGPFRLLEIERRAKARVGASYRSWSIVR